MAVKLTAFPTSKVRYEQMRAVAHAESKTISQWLDEKIAGAFKHHFPHEAPTGFTVELVEHDDEKPFLKFGHDDIGTIELDLDQAEAFAMGAFLTLDRQRDFTCVYARKDQHVSLRCTAILKRVYSLCIARGKNQKTLDLHGRVLRDLVSVVLDKVR